MKTQMDSTLITIREDTPPCKTSWIMRAARMAMPHPMGTKKGGTIKLKIRAVKMKSSMINVMTERLLTPD